MPAIDFFVAIGPQQQQAPSVGITCRWGGVAAGTIVDDFGGWTDRPREPAMPRVGNYATAWMDSWRVTQQILYGFRNKFLLSSPRNSIIAFFDARRSL